MRMLRQSGLVGSLDVTELNPLREAGGRTAGAVVLVASLFGGCRRAARSPAAGGPFMGELGLDLIARESRLGARNYEPLNVVLCRGAGVWVWDVDGNRYLDCLSAYSAVSQGHCHPEILAAMVAQAQKLTLTSRAFRNDQLAYFYEDLARLTGSHKILPMNSGAEAVETAIKAAQMGLRGSGVPQDKAEIIVCADNFHGRTIAIVGFSTDPTNRDGFGPSRPASASSRSAIDAFAAAIGPNTVGFLVEPIQGEAGVIIPPPGYFKQVRELCSERRITLVLDEIQTGLGRTGKLLAEEHEGIEADVTLLGKALSGGFYPISAVLEFRGAGRAQAGRAWLDVRRQSARLRGGARRAARARRGGHDRERGNRGRLPSARSRASGLKRCGRSAAAG